MKKNIELQDVPLSDVGDSCLEIVATDGKLTIEYLNNISSGEYVYVEFVNPYIHTFGPPDDSAFNAHPLYRMGLRPYSSVEVLESVWIDALESMNSIHPYHDKNRFLKNKRHLIFSFHDNTFECVAMSYKVYKKAQLGDAPEPAST